MQSLKDSGLICSHVPSLAVLLLISAAPAKGAENARQQYTSMAFAFSLPPCEEPLAAWGYCRTVLSRRDVAGCIVVVRGLVPHVFV